MAQNQNALYQYYLQQGNRQPLSQLQVNNQQQEDVQANDVDFQDIWKYLKWARKAYDLYAKASGNPTTGNYLNKAWDYGKDWLSGGQEAAPMAAEAGGASASDMAAANAYDTAFSGQAAEAAGSGASTGLASEGVAGVGTTGWASLAAPLIMTYLAYTKGSGVNEPVRKQYETQGAGKALMDMLNGQQVTDWSKYGLKDKPLQGYQDQFGEQMSDPRGYSPLDLWEGMHRYGTGHYQTGGVGNSGLSDQQIDDMFGDKKGDLAKLVGFENGLPDWTGKRWDDKNAFDPNDNPWGKQETALNDAFSQLTDEDKTGLYSRNMGIFTGRDMDERWLKQALQSEQQQAELEKAWGYKKQRSPWETTSYNVY